MMAWNNSPVYVDVYIHVDTHRLYIYIHTCLFICIYIYMLLYIFTNTRTRVVYVLKYTHIYTYIHTYIYTYRYIYIYIYIRILYFQYRHIFEGNSAWMLLGLFELEAQAHRLLTLVIALAETGASLAADSINPGVSFGVPRL